MSTGNITWALTKKKSLKHVPGNLKRDLRQESDTNVLDIQEQKVVSLGQDQEGNTLFYSTFWNHLRDRF